MRRIYEKTVKRVLLSTFIVLLSMVSFAATYYVSTAGDDSNSGLTSSLAWKTLARVNAATLSAGDQVLFQKGDTFYGSLTISSSGTSGSPIICGAYGSGANPIITGFTTVDTWNNLGGNIWESAAAVSTLSTCNMVAINGINTGMGRYPNAGSANAGYLTFQSHSGSTSITSSSLTSTPNWTGGEVVIRCGHFVLERPTITSQSGGTLNFTPATSYENQNGFGFFIQNDIRTLDAQNEWYYNKSTKKLSIYSSTTPANVKLATVDCLFSANGNYLTLDGIDFDGSNGNTINGRGIKTTIKNCNISFSGIGLIKLSGVNSLIENNVISNSNEDAIIVDGNRSIIRNNTIQNSGTIRGMGYGVNSAVHVGGSGTVKFTVENNRIINSGMNGISFYGDSVTVKNNFVDTFCSVLDDGGGIYTYTGGSRPLMKGVKIEGNIVINGIGAPAGSTTSFPSIAAGIYCDNVSSDVDIFNNSIANCSVFGILNNQNTNINIHGNTVFNSSTAQHRVIDSDGLISNNNIFVSKSSAQWCFYISRWTDGIEITSDNNYFARPMDDNKTIHASQPSNGGGLKYLKTLDDWKTFSGEDRNSHKSPQAITNVNDLRFEYNETKTAKTITLSQPMIDVKGVKYSGTVTLQPYTSVVLMKDANATPIIQDLTPPVIAEFSVPTTVNSLTVPISSFDATDNIEVTGYLITETSSNPSTGTEGWTALAPSNYVFSSDGSKTLYAWVKDAAGNVNKKKNSTVMIGMDPLTTVVNSSVEFIKIDIFPNPSNGRVTIRFTTQPEAGSRIDILDMSGRKVASRMITKMSEEFNLDQHAPGIYLVKSILGANETIHKLVVN